MSMSFDIFIPVGPKDFKIINYTVSNLKKNVIGYKDIYIFSEYKNFNIKDTKDINEDFFPFSKKQITDLVRDKSRAGWIYQQLVCLYFPYLQNYSEKILVVDSDVFFTKKTKFINEDKGIFTLGKENHTPYFEHMSRLHPEITKFNQDSGISHHMLFNKYILKSMFELVENHHKKDFFKTYIEKLDPTEKSSSADYEIYFNYALKFFNDSYTTRTLKWSNLEKLSFDSCLNYDMVSLPHWKKSRPDNFKYHIKSKNFSRAFFSIKNYIFIKLLLN